MGQWVSRGWILKLVGYRRTACYSKLQRGNQDDPWVGRVKSWLSLGCAGSLLKCKIGAPEQSGSAADMVAHCALLLLQEAELAYQQRILFCAACLALVLDTSSC